MIQYLCSEMIFYLAMQQLRLRASSSFYVEADFVKERHSKLLLVHSAKAIHHLCSPTWNTQDAPLGPYGTTLDKIFSCCRHCHGVIYEVTQMSANYNYSKKLFLNGHLGEDLTLVT